jgi:exo-beta-1,3-glucanase (GH17 family)
MVRSAVSQPITNADDYLYWLEDQSKEIAEEIDFISTHIHPLWNKRSLDESIPWIDSIYAQLMKIHPDKPIVITETGWATDYDSSDVGEGAQGTQFRQAPNQDQQVVFYHAINDWAQKNRVMTYWFEIFDESWKGGGENTSPHHAEKNWGLFYEDRTPKLVMRDQDDR